MKKYFRHLVMAASAAVLLISCGSGTTETAPQSTQAETSETSKAISFSLDLSAGAQCSDVATVAAGIYHTVGLKTDGTVAAAGFNTYGQLKVSSWTNIKAIAAGGYHTVGLKDDGTVAATGYNGYGQLNLSSWTNIKALAAGIYHTVGLKDDGTVVAAGYNTYDQLNVSSWTNIKSIAAGGYHTVGLKDDGTVVATGYSTSGQLNVSTWTNIKAIAAGAYHTVGLKDDGTVVATGYNNYGQLKVSSWTNIKAIAAGVYHTVGLKDDGTVVATGFNTYGQLNVSSWTDIKAIAAGGYHTVGLKADGTAAAVGYNGYGQLNVSSWTDLLPLCDASCAVTTDAIPPTTTALITGTQGNAGWYVSDVQIKWSSTDDEGGSGVKEIHYFIDGVEAVVQASSASFTLTADGTHVVAWYAVDNAGNAEAPPLEMTINIDKTSPAITSLGADAAILWPPNGKMVNVMIGGSVADDASGVASTAITVTDEYGVYNMTVDGFGKTVPLEASRLGTDKDGRVYTITAVTTDLAGNQSTAVTRVVVPHNM